MNQLPPLLPPIGTNILFYLATLLCIGSVVVVLLFFLPLLIKQARVRNGLRKLRIEMLIMGANILFTDTVASYFLIITSMRLLNNPDVHVTTLTQILLFLFASSKFVVGVLGYRIYRAQYTVEHIEVSNKVEAIMEGRRKAKEGVKP